MDFRGLRSPLNPSDLSDTVQVQLDLRQPHTQSIGVRMQWTPTTQRQVWQLPVWTPGSYTVRDHVQHLHSLRLFAGSSERPIRRLGPSQWLVDLDQLEPLTLDYTVTARDLTVRTCYLDPDVAALCLAGLVMELDGCRWSSHALSVLAPEHWQVHVPLDRLGDGWSAADLDALIDSPVHAGRFSSTAFKVAGQDHELVLIDAPPSGWPEALQADVEAVCAATCRLLGTAPPAGDRYQLVIQLLERGYGGLEHDHSSVLHYSRTDLHNPDGYRKLLQLIGHEYLHQWNVRRLRPLEYRPYDYSRAVVSEGLWFAEGITSYYDLTFPLLAGRSDRRTLLKDLGDDLSRVLLTPGRQIQSLAASAREAWVKLYKATPASRDDQVSYYGLGAATAFCLDVRLRDAGSSLAIVLRALWQSHGVHGRGYGRGDLVALIRTHNQELADALAEWLDDPDSLPLHETASMLGLDLVPSPSKDPHHGLTLSLEKGCIVVTRVEAGSPAQVAQLVVGDELIAVEGLRLRRTEDLPGLLRHRETSRMTYARRGRLGETSVSPVSGVDHWQLSWDPGASVQQQELRDRWFEFL